MEEFIVKSTALTHEKK